MKQPERGYKSLLPLLGVGIALGLQLRRAKAVARPRPAIGPPPDHVSHDVHGRGATRPAGIPSRGWRDILLRLKDRVARDNLTIVAGGVAFFAFLAIPSTLSALVSLYGLVFDPVDVQRQVASMHGVIPGEAIKLVSDQLQSLTSHSSSKLSVGFVVSLLLALWSTRSSTASMIAAINIAYEEEEKRGLIKFQLVALALTAATILFAIVALALVAVLPAVVDLLPLGNAGKIIAAIIRWPMLVILVAAALAGLYRFAPCRDEPKWRWVSWGAALATVLWIIASALFSVYVSEFAVGREDLRMLRMASDGRVDRFVPQINRRVARHRGLRRIENDTGPARAYPAIPNLDCPA
jgi:membrane protein